VRKRAETTITINDVACYKQQAGTFLKKMSGSLREDHSRPIYASVDLSKKKKNMSQRILT